MMIESEMHAGEVGDGKGGIRATVQAVETAWIRSGMRSVQILHVLVFCLV